MVTYKTVAVSTFPKGLKKQNDAATIIKTANNSLDDKLEGLDLDTDNYLTMFYHLAEVKCPIKAV